MQLHVAIDRARRTVPTILDVELFGQILACRTESSKRSSPPLLVLMIGRNKSLTPRKSKGSSQTRSKCVGASAPVCEICLSSIYGVQAESPISHIDGFVVRWHLMSQNYAAFLSDRQW